MTKGRINFIGFKNKNTKGFEYEVIEKLGRGKWRVRFVETGYETISEAKEIRNGNIKDWKAPYVCGVGIVGVNIERPQKHYLYDRWRDMLRRCYDTKNKMYYSYGAMGVYVSKDWLYFENFVRDMENKENIENLKSETTKWQIDKDIICSELNIVPHYYSNETVMIVERKKNILERNERCGNPSEKYRKAVMQFDVDGNFVREWESMLAVSTHFGSENTTQISNCCTGKKGAKTYKGYYWMFKHDFVDFKCAKDKFVKMSNTKRRSSKKKVIVVRDIYKNVVFEGFCEDVAKEFGLAQSSVYGAISRGDRFKNHTFEYKEVDNSNVR